MVAVVNTPAVVRAVTDRLFVPDASHVVQPDTARTRTVAISQQIAFGSVEQMPNNDDRLWALGNKQVGIHAGCWLVYRHKYCVPLA